MHTSSTLLQLTLSLREAGYKVTSSRLAILALFIKTKKPQSVQDVIHQLRKECLDQVTVYRTLTLLKSIGLVRQIDFQHGAAYYELAPLQEHHHVICTRCQRIEDVEECCVETDMHTKALRQSGFAEITEHSLEFFGLCRECKH